MEKIFLFLIILSFPASRSAGMDNPDNGLFLPASKGFLIVHTVTEAEYYDGIDKIYYDSYRILDESGKLVKKIHKGFEAPVTVSLEEGTYIIDAKLKDGNLEKIIAKIEAGKTTEVK